MWFSKSDYLWNHCCGQTQNEAEGFLRNKPSWTPVLLFYTLSRDLAAAQVRSLGCADGRSNRGSQSKRKEREENSELGKTQSIHSEAFICHMSEQQSSVSLCVTLMCRQRDEWKEQTLTTTKPRARCHKLCREPWLCISVTHGIQWGNRFWQSE